MYGRPPLQACPVLSAGTVDGQLEPVSYTHLDVYKRQVTGVLAVLLLL